jgi:hypothetical protein
MVESRGDWSANPQNKGFADTVLEAVASSGQLYREGLGMIAS